MLAVNLLPWRARHWQRRRQQSLMWLCAILMLGACVVITLWLRGHQQLQLLRQRVLAADAALVTLQQQRAQQQALLQQRAQLLQIQHAREQRRLAYQRWHYFWQQLPDVMPASLWLSRIARREQLMTLEGTAQDMAAVRDFRQRLAAHSLLRAVKPATVQRQSDGHYRFALQARLEESPDD
ncbi:PilN domain-containing protein [Pantoea sp. Mb-10]|uniref:PilN domain-containing protein n=1 Tax=unclassified Pantoea TaxID=2630326 RepID=UPI001E611722|nr:MULTISPECIES: PilN domain-containing protein [unclassified Pantoea]MCE0492174.1 PilN domain-containing protein [Pantoea sp. Mb-10]MCE0503205.1 PilN domain-containing protein [Pantoea sp. Pb-8]